MNIRQILLPAVGLLLLAVVLSGRAAPATQIYFTASSIVLCGWHIMRSACAALLDRRVEPGLLTALAVIGVIVIGKLFEAALFMAVISVASLLQVFCAERRRNALYAGYPAEDGAGLIRPGDTVVLQKGQTLPVDAIIKDGAARLLSSPFPVGSLRPGAVLFAGSSLSEGQLVLEAVGTQEDAWPNKAVAVNKAATTEKEAAARLLYSREYARRLLTVIFFMAIPFYFFQSTMINWIYYTLVILLIFAPYTAMIKLHSLLFSFALDKAARLGGIVLRPDSLEETGRIKAAAFEKAATLSEGKLIMANVYAPYPFSRPELTGLAAALTGRAEHSLAGAVARFADNPATDAQVVITEQDGLNLAGQVAGRAVLLGSNAFVSARGVKTAILLRKYSEYLASGSTVLFMAVDGEAAGLLSFIDDIHPGIFAAIKKMQLLGLENVIMLAGDQRKPVKSGRIADFTQAPGHASEAAQAAAVKKLHYKYGSILVVGNAETDSAAFSHADVSIAVDACSNLDKAQSAADIVLLSDHRVYLAELFAVSRRYVKYVSLSKRFYILIKFVLLGLVIFNYLYIWQAMALDGLAGLAALLSARRLFFP